MAYLRKLAGYNAQGEKEPVMYVARRRPLICYADDCDHTDNYCPNNLAEQFRIAEQVAYQLANTIDLTGDSEDEVEEVAMEDAVGPAERFPAMPPLEAAPAAPRMGLHRADRTMYVNID